MRGTLAERFWSKVDKSGGEPACWPWSGWVNPYGYGYYGSGRDGMPRFAHRRAFVLAHGRALRPGEFVLHACDNRRCCNPAHLRAGTLKDNYEDARSRGRHSHGERHGLVRDPSRAARGERVAKKLAESDVREIRRLAADGVSRHAIAGRFGVSRANIGYIVRREIWAHVG